MKIELFGRSTTSGDFFYKKLQENNQEENVISYSRNKKDCYFIDFEKPQDFKTKLIDEKRIWILLHQFGVFIIFKLGISK